MGHSSKKKKKGGGGGGGGGRRSKGRATLKDHSSHDGGDNELLADEITALCAIFQEDCKVVSDSPHHIILKLRPHTKDMGYEDLDICAILHVKCLPGYPYKSPKLQITPEKGLTKTDADRLLSLLHDQANFDSREGRVMIYNLVEAAQEFLSEVVPGCQSNDSHFIPHTSGGSQLLQNDDAISSSRSSSLCGPFVYGFVDLFGGSMESWNWTLDVDDNRGIVSSVQLSATDKVADRKPEMNPKPWTIEEKKQGPVSSPAVKLDTLKEETEDESKDLSSSGSSNSEKGSITSDMEGDKEGNLREVHGTDDDYSYPESEPSESSTSFSREQGSENIEKDLMMVHLLHLACASKGDLNDALPEIMNELCSFGIFSEWLRDLASKPSSLFRKTFNHVFNQHMIASRASQFWKPALDLGGPSASLPSSRYLNDFEELHSLGHGGFGHVVLCKNKLDGRQYAVKKIRLKDKNLSINDRILREVTTLSRLQHQHVVRYYQAWIETGTTGSYGETWGSGTAASSMASFTASSTDVPGQENRLEVTYLYIQMEYCPRTLRHVFDSHNHFDKELVWHLFRQIVEGLVHIHGQGIIHRDLTPNNIFFDARNDIKIGDFGLAKFLRFEQVDQDGGFPTDTVGVSLDGTGQVGTLFYTAPEIEQGWPKIDEKADMYSLGVVFFELWHPFGTAMERHAVLSDLKQKGELPSAWVAEFPDQASLLRHLMSQSPSDRPSATELLQNAFPPRMEYELLDNILSTMWTSEDTSVYDKVVNAIFDEEILQVKNQPYGGKLRTVQHDTLSTQYTDLDTEVRDCVAEVTREMFKRHCAKRLEIVPVRLLDDCPLFNRNTVKILTHGGDMLELCHELRLPFVTWVVANQKSSFKRYEISTVYRRAIGHSPPNRYLQGDFDIIGGASPLPEAEVLKVTMDILTRFFLSDLCDIHFNHGLLLEAIWSWVGINAKHRRKVAELLSMMGSLRPQSSERKLKWVVIRRQLLQEMKLAEATVNRLQTVGLRFCGSADQALPRLRGALPADKATRRALDELSDLFSYLRIWRIEKNVYIDALMPPTEDYHRDLYFQEAKICIRKVTGKHVYIIRGPLLHACEYDPTNPEVYSVKENAPGSITEGIVLAIGGRYDYLLHQAWEHEYKTSPPGAVGTSLAVETIIQHSPVDLRPLRNEATISVLVCSRGGGGLLVERMELVSELWEHNIKAEFVPVPDPSLTEQYEYANEHDIKCLVIMTDTGVSQTDSVKVRHLDLKKEKEVEREKLVRFLLDGMATQFRNFSVWT